jgi:hypothetical protein
LAFRAEVKICPLTNTDDNFTGFTSFSGIQFNLSPLAATLCPLFLGVLIYANLRKIHKKIFKRKIKAGHKAYKTTPQNRLNKENFQPILPAWPLYHPSP